MLNADKGKKPMFSTTNGRRGTVLLVDDDDQIRAMCRIFLEQVGFLVLEADNALEALLIAAERKGIFDLAITDIAMPNISGAELGRAFQELWPDRHVLYMSGSPWDAVREELPTNCAFLAKPFAADELVNAVRSCLGPFAEVQRGQEAGESVDDLVWAARA